MVAIGRDLYNVAMRMCGCWGIAFGCFGVIGGVWLIIIAMSSQKKKKKKWAPNCSVSFGQVRYVELEVVHTKRQRFNNEVATGAG